MNLSLKKWIAAATPAQRARLAYLAGTSSAYLSHIVSGFRIPKVDTAAAIEDASRYMVARGEPLPIVSRATLCTTCAKCPHYRASKNI